MKAKHPISQCFKALVNKKDLGGIKTPTPSLLNSCSRPTSSLGVNTSQSGYGSPVAPDGLSMVLQSWYYHTVLSVVLKEFRRIIVANLIARRNTSAIDTSGSVPVWWSVSGESRE